MAKPRDGKIRIRCTGCGKRVKFPAIPGQTYRCPICHTIIVAPLDAGDITPPTAQEMQAVSRKAASPSQAPAQPVWSDAAPQKAPSERDSFEDLLNSIERLNAFIGRQAQRNTLLCREVLMDRAMPQKEQFESLRQLRHTKAISLRKYVEAALKDLNRAIETLEENPAAETKTVQEKLDRLKWERRSLLLYVKVMFELRWPTQAENAPNAKPGTRGGGAAPANTSLKQAAQTPEGKADAAPAPDNKGPGNSESPAC